MAEREKIFFITWVLCGEATVVRLRREGGDAMLHQPFCFPPPLYKRAPTARHTGGAEIADLGAKVRFFCDMAKFVRSKAVDNRQINTSLIARLGKMRYFQRNSLSALPKTDLFRPPN